MFESGGKIVKMVCDYDTFSSKFLSDQKEMIGILEHWNMGPLECWELGVCLGVLHGLLPPLQMYDYTKGVVKMIQLSGSYVTFG